MFFVKQFLPRSTLALMTLSLCLILDGCNMSDDLLPSGNDARETVVTGSIGSMPGQIAENFIIKDSLNNDFNLSEHLNAGSHPADVVVLYFTMWCPICLSHNDHIYNTVMPQFRGRGVVVYALVDYVSGNVSATHAAELANGYDGSDFTVLSDNNQIVLNQFNAAMGIVVVIDSDGTILLNEDYRNGSALITRLDEQLP
jgi:peroxiredoxin